MTETRELISCNWTNKRHVIMEFADRKAFVEDLEQFVEKTRPKIDDVLNRLGWNALNTQKETDENHVICSHDISHIIKLKNQEEHEERCSLRADGYSISEIKEAPPNSKFFYEKSNAVHQVKIDKALQDEIFCNSLGYNTDSVQKKVPRTPQRTIIELNMDERAAIHDYVVSQTQLHLNREPISAEQLNDFVLNTDKKSTKSDGDHKSMLEVFAEQRDFKRRRQSYRAKNVHITKRSHTDVIREVIASQVESWTQYLKDISHTGEDDSKQHQTSHRSNNNGHSQHENNDNGRLYKNHGEHDEENYARQHHRHHRNNDRRTHHVHYREHDHYSKHERSPGKSREKNEKHKHSNRSRSRSVESHRKHKSTEDKYKRSRSKSRSQSPHSERSPRKSHKSKKKKHKRSRSKSETAESGQEAKKKHKHRKKKKKHDREP